MRIYLPATVRMLREFFEQQQFRPLSGTAFALTPALRESYSSGDAEELEYAAMREAARASLRLIATELGESREDEQEEKPEHPRRVVVSADVREEEVTLRPDLDYAVVRLANPVPWKKMAAVHVDTAEAEEAVRQVAPLIDDADLGDEKAELALGDAEDHELAWFAPQEVPFMLELM